MFIILIGFGFIILWDLTVLPKTNNKLKTITIYSVIFGASLIIVFLLINNRKLYSPADLIEYILHGIGVIK